MPTSPILWNHTLSYLLFQLLRESSGFIVLVVEKEK